MGVNFIFLRKKGDFSSVFSAFYGQRSVTAAWVTRSPWSILNTFYKVLYYIFLEAEPLSTYLCLSACPPARPKFLVVRAKLYSPNLGKYIIGVNVVVWFVCLCHGPCLLVWTLTSSNTISAGRTDGSTPPTSAT